MKTELMLWTRYERESVPLADVAREYLGMSKDATLQALPAQESTDASFACHQ